ncbi:MAG TPA: hypothetical protein VFD69_19070 [Vicinamibacterales bacterium]|nr:hypothetical protein [Vicinamibacterales bacterium]
MSTTSAPIRATPWHLWVVAFLTFFWNGSGAVTIVMAQRGGRLDLNPNEIAYYADQPFWFVLATDLALVLPIAAAVALLLRSRSAAWLFALSLLTVVLNNAYDVAAGTSLALGDQGWRIVTIVIVAVALTQFAYAWSMKTRGVLK